MGGSINRCVVTLDHSLRAGNPECWYDMDADAPWRVERPGPSPFKREGNIFAGVPGASEPSSILPDIVHTFHIGFGSDMVASMVVWLCELGKFGATRSLDSRLQSAYTSFQQYCYDTKRHNSCDEWCMKKFGMKSFPGLIDFFMFPYAQEKQSAYRVSCPTKAA